LSALAQRYAAAFADVALERKDPERVRGDLSAFLDAYHSSPDLENFLSNPSIENNVKKEFLGKLAERMSLAPELKNFLFVLVDHYRTELLRDFMPIFQTELNSRLGIAEAQVTSAHELSARDKEELKQTLERTTGKTIEMKFSVDQSLLGGAVVQIGSTIYNGSVRERLERMRTQFEAE
jgi:F-type H+-transporting ATPase subunit delta